MYQCLIPKIKLRGEFGEFGDPYSDTWESGMVRPGIALPADAYVHDRRDELVIRTTVGRDRDEKYAAGSFIRAAGVDGANVAATGGTQFLATLDPVDIRFGGSRLRRKPDDMREGRRRKGHAEMWHAHAGDKLKPSAPDSQLGRVSKRDGPLAPWHGQPQRHWMQKGREVDKTKRSGLLSSAHASSTGPPVSSASKIVEKDTAAARGDLSEHQAAMQGSGKYHTHLERLDTLRLLSRDAAKARKEPPPKPGTPAESRERVGISRGGMAWWLENDSERDARTPPKSAGDVSDFKALFSRPGSPLSSVGGATTSDMASQYSLNQIPRTASRGTHSRNLRSRDALDIFFDASRESTPAASVRKSFRNTRGSSRKSSARASSARTGDSNGGVVRGSRSSEGPNERSATRSRGALGTRGSERPQSRGINGSKGTKQVASSPMILPGSDLTATSTPQSSSGRPPRQQMSKLEVLRHARYNT